MELHEGRYYTYRQGGRPVLDRRTPTELLSLVRQWAARDGVAAWARDEMRVTQIVTPANRPPR